MQNLNRKIDELLVVKIQSGNKKALAQLVKLRHKQFCNRAYWLVKDKAIAKDIAQESWQIIIDKIEGLKDPSQFISWALKIVSNKSLDHLRLKARERESFQNYKAETEISEPYDENLKLKQKLLSSIKRLPVNQQTVIRLFYTESYSLQQISKTLNISKGTTKSRLFYAREKLKQELKNYNYEN
jgi:RNA polymerase sigma factor (sigma-70 family)